MSLSITDLILPIASLIAAAAGAWVLRAFVQAAEKTAAPGSAPPKPLLPLAAVAAAAICALGLYLLVGRPDLPDQPLSARVAKLQQQDPTTLAPPQVMAILTARAKAAPKDPRPYYFMGQLLAAEGDFQKASQSFEIALMRDPLHALSALELARLRVQMSGGEVTPEALALFKAAATLNPDDPLPWFYQALAATSEERWADAKVYWVEAQKRFPESDPRQMMIAQMRAEAEAKARTAQR